MSDFMRIDLSNFDNRKEEIAQDLMKAASEHGFFYGNYPLSLLLSEQKVCVKIYSPCKHLSLL